MEKRNKRLQQYLMTKPNLQKLFIYIVSIIKELRDKMNAHNQQKITAQL